MKYAVNLSQEAFEHRKVTQELVLSGIHKLNDLLLYEVMNKK